MQKERLNGSTHLERPQRTKPMLTAEYIPQSTSLTREDTLPDPISEMPPYLTRRVWQPMPKKVSYGFHEDVSGSESDPYASIRMQAADRFLSMKTWSGTVISTEEDTFWARVTDRKGIEEDMEFFAEDIADDDRELLTEGAFFFFNIGFSTSRFGQRERKSILKFRRIPHWTNDEILDATEKAMKRLKLINVE